MAIAETTPLAIDNSGKIEKLGNIGALGHVFQEGVHNCLHRIVQMGNFLLHGSGHKPPHAKDQPQTPVWFASYQEAMEAAENAAA